MRCLLTKNFALARHVTGIIMSENSIFNSLAKKNRKITCPLLLLLFLCFIIPSALCFKISLYKYHNNNDNKNIPFKKLGQMLAHLKPSAGVTISSKLSVFIHLTVAINKFFGQFFALSDLVLFINSRISKGKNKKKTTIFRHYVCLFLFFFIVHYIFLIYGYTRTGKVEKDVTDTVSTRFCVYIVIRKYGSLVE